jgi:N-carbamoylputrescine amidase
MENNIKVGLVQQSVGTEIANNTQKLVANIRDCAQRGAKLVVLQELHNTPYFCQVEDVANFDLAEPIPGQSTAL